MAEPTYNPEGDEVTSNLQALRDELSRLTPRAEAITGRRDQLIRELRDGGASLRAIGEAAGLSHTAIAKILERGEQ